MNHTQTIKTVLAIAVIVLMACTAPQAGAVIVTVETNAGDYISSNATFVTGYDWGPGPVTLDMPDGVWSMSYTPNWSWYHGANVTVEGDVVTNVEWVSYPGWHKVDDTTISCAGADVLIMQQPGLAAVYYYEPGGGSYPASWGGETGVRMYDGAWEFYSSDWSTFAYGEVVISGNEAVSVSGSAAGEWALDSNADDDGYVLWPAANITFESNVGDNVSVNGVTDNATSALGVRDVLLPEGTHQLYYNNPAISTSTHGAEVVIDSNLAVTSVTKTSDYPAWHQVDATTVSCRGANVLIKPQPGLAAVYYYEPGGGGAAPASWGGENGVRMYDGAWEFFSSDWTTFAYGEVVISGNEAVSVSGSAAGEWLLDSNVLSPAANFSFQFNVNDYVSVNGVVDYSTVALGDRELLLTAGTHQLYYHTLALQAQSHGAEVVIDDNLVITSVTNNFGYPGWHQIDDTTVSCRGVDVEIIQRPTYDIVYYYEPGGGSTPATWGGANGVRMYNGDWEFFTATSWTPPPPWMWGMITISGDEMTGVSGDSAFYMVDEDTVATFTEITCPADVEIVCGEPADTGTATAIGGCGAPTVTFSDVVAAAVTTRTWTATDACNDADSCVQVITETVFDCAAVEAQVLSELCQTEPAVSILGLLNLTQQLADAALAEACESDRAPCAAAILQTVNDALP